MNAQSREAHNQPKPFAIADDLVLRNLQEAEELYRQGQTPRGQQVADPVVVRLDQAGQLYRQFQARLESQVADLLAARAEMASLRETNDQLTHALRGSQRQMEQERERAKQHRERANQLNTILKDIHRSLFSGNIYNLILKACITITGATRGLYLTRRGPEDTLRIRAAIDVDGYPQTPPSEFISALCRTVLGDKDTLICNTPDDLGRFPAPAGVGEQFQNCLVAPVVLLKNLDGILIVADKLNGEFEQEDVDTLLSVGDQAAVAVENVRLRQELQHAYRATVSTLAEAMEARDPYTRGHCEEVAGYARAIAERLDLPEEAQQVVYYAALLHDVGKIGVSDGVLHKPGSLLPAERELVRAHARIGADLLRAVPALQLVADVVLHHHEWYDGTGYPDRLKGDEIPLASRIVGVVDAYSAMTAKRSYREACSPAQARDELLRCAGAQFDPLVVEAFLAILDSADIRAADDEDEDEHGLLPGFGHLREAQ